MLMALYGHENVSCPTANCPCYEISPAGRTKKIAAWAIKISPCAWRDYVLRQNDLARTPASHNEAKALEQIGLRDTKRRRLFRGDIFGGQSDPEPSVVVRRFRHSRCYW